MSVRSLFVVRGIARRLVVTLSALAVGLIGSVPDLRAAEAVGTDLAEGAALAAELRTARPTHSFTNAAILHRRLADGRRTRVPIRIETVVPSVGEDWTVTYRTEPVGNVGVETLTLHYRPGQVPDRHLTRNGSATSSPVGPNEPFAGSDFSVSDLALEFLHWPEQKVIRRDRPEMRKGRPCRILESSRPATDGASGGVVRVRSWIDLEHKQPLMAEAFDARGALIKAFSVGSVKKVDGVWQLKDLEIVDEQSGTLTRLEFDWTVK
jgi:hypothetical protein